MKGFSAFLDTRQYKNRAHKINSWNYPTIWGPVWSFFFPKYGVPLPWPPPWTVFRECWKSAAIAAPEHHFRGRWQVPMTSANLYSNASPCPSPQCTWVWVTPGVGDGQEGHGVLHSSAKSWTRLSDWTEQNWIVTFSKGAPRLHQNHLEY